MSSTAFPLRLLSLALAIPLCLLSLAGGCAPPLANGQGEGGGHGTEADLPAGVHTYRLENGLRLIVRESHARAIVTIDTWVATGSANETAENNGVSHFLEHLLFKGTERVGPRELDRRLEALGAEINAATGDDTTHFYVTVPSAQFEPALDLHADMMLHAALPPKEIDHERKVVIEEINRANDNPRRKLYLKMQALLYKRHPYRLDTLGPAENIATISREAIVSYYRRWYVPPNMTLVVVGDVKASEVRDRVGRYFRQAGGKAPPPIERPTEPPLERPASVSLEERVGQAHLALAWRTVPAREIEEGAALDVAALVLGQGRSSRLYQRLVEREHLALQVTAAHYNQRDDGVFFVYAVCEPAKVERVRAIIAEEVAGLARAPITQDELDKALLSLDRDFVYNAESTGGIASLYGYYASIAKFSDVFDYRSKLSHIDALRVLEAVRRHLRPDRTAAVRLLPEGTDLAAIESAPPPAAPPPASAAPEQQAIVRSELPGGTVLLVKPTRGGDVVAFHGRLAGGTRVAGRAGLADLASRLALKGTQARSAEELAREIEGRGLSLEVSADEDSIVLTGKALKGELPHLLVLLRDVFYNATFPAGEIEREKTRMLQEITLSRERPSGVAFEQARLKLFPHHPYGDVGKRIERDLPSLTRQDVLDYYRAQFRPERLTLAIVGDVAPEEVRAQVATLFPARQGPAPRLLSEPQPQGAPTKPQVVRTARPTAQTWLVQAYLTPSLSSADYAPLKLLATLLGQGLSSRLFTSLRERRGLAYTTSAAYGSHVDPSGFYLYIGTDPVNTRAVQEGFDAELERLRTELVGPEELREAKQKFLGAFYLGHETSADQAFYLAFYEMAGLGWQFDERYPQLIEAVSAEQIRKAARRYLSGPSVKSLVGPAKEIAEGAALPSLEEIPIIPEE